jgi:hypothetical protein
MLAGKRSAQGAGLPTARLTAVYPGTSARPVRGSWSEITATARAAEGIDMMISIGVIDMGGKCGMHRLRVSALRGAYPVTFMKSSVAPHTIAKASAITR